MVVVTAGARTEADVARGGLPWVVPVPGFQSKTGLRRRRRGPGGGWRGVMPVLAVVTVSAPTPSRVAGGRVGRGGAVWGSKPVVRSALAEASRGLAPVGGGDRERRHLVVVAGEWFAVGGTRVGFPEWMVRSSPPEGRVSPVQVMVVSARTGPVWPGDGRARAGSAGGGSRVGSCRRRRLRRPGAGPGAAGGHRERPHRARMAGERVAVWGARVGFQSRMVPSSPAGGQGGSPWCWWR